jgi:hypothetical protein
MRLGAYEGYRPYSEGDWEQFTPRPTRRSTRAGKRRATADAPGRRHALRSGRSSRSDRMVRPTATGPMAMAARGFIDFARGGVSRTCLTPAARALLDRIEAQFGSVGIVSTCRPGAVIAGSGRPSRHASGNAIDFNAPTGRKLEVVRWLIANHRAGGVMTYSDMNHIHVDVGRHFVALGAASGGARAGWRKRMVNSNSE